MEIIETALPIILYGLGAVLLVIFIIIGVKILKTMNKIGNVVDDVNDKVKSLDKFFNIIDFTTDKLSAISDKIVDAISSFIMNLFRKKKKEEKEEKEKND